MYNPPPCDFDKAMSLLDEVLTIAGTLLVHNWADMPHRGAEAHAVTLKRATEFIVRINSDMEKS